MLSNKSPNNGRRIILVASAFEDLASNVYATDSALSIRGWPDGSTWDAHWDGEAGPSSRAGTTALHAHAVNAVVEAMYAHLPGGLSLGEMGEIAHLSPYHLCRVFRQTIGVPPAEFLAALRVQEAKRLLLTTRLSVTDVCFELGYRSLGTFTSRFTQAVGVAPGRLRRHADVAAETLDGLYNVVPEPLPVHRVPAAGAVVSGRVTAAGMGPCLIFIGLFPTGIPQGRPVACTRLTVPGAYRITGAPDGCYHLRAAALPRSDHAIAYLLPHAGMRVGVGRGPLLVRGGSVLGCPDLSLHPIAPTDPPVVVSLPFLVM